MLSLAYFPGRSSRSMHVEVLLLGIVVSMELSGPRSVEHILHTKKGR